MTRSNTRVAYIDTRSTTWTSIRHVRAQQIAKAVAGTEARPSFLADRWWLVPARFTDDLIAAVEAEGLIPAVTRPKAGGR